jgi:hypothetical protein
LPENFSLCFASGIASKEKQLAPLVMLNCNQLQMVVLVPNWLPVDLQKVPTIQKNSTHL